MRRKPGVLDLNDLAPHQRRWLRGSGPESDIVISSRIRLARNLADFPVYQPGKSAGPHRHRASLREAVLQYHEAVELEYLNVNELKGIDRQFLVERQLISREHAESEGSRRGSGPARTSQPDDQRRGSPADPGDALRAGPAGRLGPDRPDRQVSGRSGHLCLSSKLGFLTACPTNVGTGVRVSVMMHLPALVITRQIDKVFRSLQKISLAYFSSLTLSDKIYLISSPNTLK